MIIPNCVEILQQGRVVFSTLKREAFQAFVRCLNFDFSKLAVLEQGVQYLMIKSGQRICKLPLLTFGPGISTICQFDNVIKQSLDQPTKDQHLALISQAVLEIFRIMIIHIQRLVRQSSRVRNLLCITFCRSGHLL